MKTKLKKLYYLAHPYTAKNGVTELQNVMYCVLIANKLIDEGYILYVPIVMTHWLHEMKRREWETWFQYDEVIMERCDGIILAGLWQESKRCLREKAWFEKKGKQVIVYRGVMGMTTSVSRIQRKWLQKEGESLIEEPK